MAGPHKIEVAQHEPSVNAASGHWSWICPAHGVGTVGNSLAQIIEPAAQHMRTEAPALDGLLR